MNNNNEQMNNEQMNNNDEQPISPVAAPIVPIAVPPEVVEKGEEQEEEEEEEEEGEEQEREEQEENENYLTDFNVDFTKKFLNVAHSCRVFPRQPLADYKKEFARYTQFLIPKVHEYLQLKKCMKIHICVYANFHKVIKGTQEIIEEKSFHLDSKSKIVLISDNIEEILDSIFNQLCERIHVKLYLSSDFIFDKVLHLDFLVLNYRPLCGSSYIPLPLSLKKCRQTILNIKNLNNDRCLELCIAACIFKEEIARDCTVNKFRAADPRRYMSHVSRISSKRSYDSTLNLNTSFKDIDNIESKNSCLSINVYYFDEKQKSIFPLRISKRQASDSIKAINLLFLQENSKTHYALIKNLQGLCKPMHTKHTGMSFFLCRYCLSSFSQPSQYHKHEDLFPCWKHQGQICELPIPNSTLKFKEHYKSIPFPFIIIFDFECFAKKREEHENKERERLSVEKRKEETSFKWVEFADQLLHLKTCTLCSEVGPCPNIKTQELISEQIPYGYGILLSSIHDQEYNYEPILKYGEASYLIDSFLIHLKELACQVKELLKINYPSNPSNLQKQMHENALNCMLCGVELSIGNKVLDHDHLLQTDNYR